MRKTKIMKRDVALRIDSLLIGIRESLGYVATYMETNLSAEEYKKYVPFIGESMGGTVKLSRRLYDEFADIVPDELKSDPKPK
jgi:hypothetical protein